MRRLMFLSCFLWVACGQTSTLRDSSSKTSDGSADRAAQIFDASPDLNIIGPDANPADAQFVCNPPAKADELFSLAAQTPFRAVSLCQYRGRVLLIANIAAKCGFTPQLGTLAQIQAQYLGKGLTILGFYSNQFAQAGNAQEQAACETQYGVNFPTFPDINVNAPNQSPIFSWLKAQPGGAGDILWNFEKFLISRSGKLIKRWPTAIVPDAAEVKAAIESALAAP